MTKSKSKDAAKTRVFLVDDHPIVRRGFQLVLGLERDLVLCGEAESGSVALTEIQKQMPDLVVVDLSLRESSGLDLIKQLRLTMPKVRVLVFTMHDEPLYAERALKAGAHGYITKEEGTEKAVEYIHRILAGKPCVSEKVQERMIEAMTGFSGGKADGTIESLSDRELQVLELIGSGLGSSDIARRLHLSVKTIESHREHIKTKLGLRRSSELVQYAFNWVMTNRRV
jgi:DNA-binding NarL/FixJ family response regulator